MAAFKQMPRPAGKVSFDLLPPSLPASLTPPVVDPAVLAANRHSLADVEQALGHPVLAGLQADAQHIAVAQDRGLLVGEVRAKSAYLADVAKLADQLRVRFDKDQRR